MDLASVKAFEWLLLSVFTISFHTHSLTAQRHSSDTKHHQHNLGQQMQRRQLTQQTDICRKKQVQETNKRKVHCIHVSLFPTFVYFLRLFILSSTSPQKIILCYF